MAVAGGSPWPRCGAEERALPAPPGVAPSACVSSGAVGVEGLPRAAAEAARSGRRVVRFPAAGLEGPR